MANTSQGKRKAKNKAKTVSFMQEQPDNQSLQESAAPARSSKREHARTSSSRSPVEVDMDRQATERSEGAALAQDDVDSPPERGIEFEEDERQGFVTQGAEADTGTSEGGESRSRIAERAFLLYAEGGFQHGHDLDHWLEAERNIMTGH